MPDPKFDAAQTASKVKMSDGTIRKGNVVLAKLKVEYAETASIKPNKYNPNRQSDTEMELLCKSIEEDGFTQPVIVRRSTMEIVDGEHRWRAAQVLGMQQIPVVFVDMTDEQVRIATLRHNRARGDEDATLVAMMLRSLDQSGAIDWAKDSLNLDDVDVENFLHSIDDSEAAASMSDSGAEAALAAAGVDVSITHQTGIDLSRARPEAAAAISEDAATALRERERKIAEAKTSQEAEMMRRDAAVFRLAVVFDSDEGRIVSEALKPIPVKRIIELCRARVERLGIPVPA